MPRFHNALPGSKTTQDLNLFHLVQFQMTLEAGRGCDAEYKTPVNLDRGKRNNKDVVKIAKLWDANEVRVLT